MLRRIAAVLFVGLLAQVFVGCGSSGNQAADGHRVDEKAIAAELNREIPGLEQNEAFKVQVRNIADLCRSSAADFRVNARSVGSIVLRRQLRRQIRAGCPWRSAELDDLLAELAAGDHGL